MAVTADSFIVSFPEFANAPSPLLAQAIVDAGVFTPSAVWGDLTDQGVALRVARFLALSPFGRGMALMNKDGSTVYDARLNELIAIVGIAAMVT